MQLNFLTQGGPADERYRVAPLFTSSARGNAPHQGVGVVVFFLGGFWFWVFLGGFMMVYEGFVRSAQEVSPSNPREPACPRATIFSAATLFLLQLLFEYSKGKESGLFRWAPSQGSVLTTISLPPHGIYYEFPFPWIGLPQRSDSRRGYFLPPSGSFQLLHMKVLPPVKIPSSPPPLMH